mmetsp:Transcript_106553/g.267887  ORF Transcript_106553/g.267887 Transcript_106553/m.267887 type:complete len:181 (+) Transcript_106553:964-1506(+)
MVVMVWVAVIVVTVRVAVAVVVSLLVVVEDTDDVVLVAVVLTVVDVFVSELVVEEDKVVDVVDVEENVVEDCVVDVTVDELVVLVGGKHKTSTSMPPSQDGVSSTVHPVNELQGLQPGTISGQGENAPLPNTTVPRAKPPFFPGAVTLMLKVVVVAPLTFIASSLPSPVKKICMPSNDMQ